MLFECFEIACMKGRDSNEHVARDSELDEELGECGLISRRFHAARDHMRLEPERFDLSSHERLETGGGGGE
jgi:hypothetical protein